MRAKLFRSVPFARSGTQQYLASELGMPGSGFISVDRPADEVRRSSPSFEFTPITVGHPDDMVSARDIDSLTVGIVSAVHFDDASQQLRGDLLIWDQAAISSIANGLRELSAGYLAEYVEHGSGFIQRDIIGNHVAIVPRGRSGSAQRIGG